MAWTLRLSETATRQLGELDTSNAQEILRYLNRLVLETTDRRERAKGLQANLWFVALSRWRLPRGLQHRGS